MGSLFKPGARARIQVTLPPNWHDISHGGRFLYTRSREAGAGVLQVSITGAKGAGDRPNSTENNLIQLLQQRSGARTPITVVSLENGQLASSCWGKTWATALCECPGLTHVQAWCISNGDDLLFATYLTRAATVYEELEEAREIAFRLALK